MAGAGNSTRALTMAPHEDRLASHWLWPQCWTERSPPVISAATALPPPRPAPSRDLTTKVTARGRMDRAGGPFLVALPVLGTLSQGARGCEGLWHPGRGPPKLPILQKGKTRAQRRGLCEVSSQGGCGRWLCVVQSTQRALTRGVGGGTPMPLKPPQMWGLYQQWGPRVCVQRSARGREQTDYGKWQSLSAPGTADCRKTLREKVTAGTAHSWKSPAQGLQRGTR